jgi:hypothetical protein
MDEIHPLSVFQNEELANIKNHMWEHAHSVDVLHPFQNMKNHFFEIINS